jgi:hypothetical protein
MRRHPKKTLHRRTLAADPPLQHPLLTPPELTDPGVTPPKRKVRAPGGRLRTPSQRVASGEKMSKAGVELPTLCLCYVAAGVLTAALLWLCRNVHE